MTTRHNIDKIFKDGLNDYSEKAPAFVWDNIQQDLNKSRFNKKRTVFYSIAASIALLLSFGAGYLFTNTTDSNQVAQLSNPVTENSVVETPQNSSNNNVVNVIEEPVEENVKQEKIEKPAEEKISKESSKEEIVIEKKKKKVKKANSSGTLLPPMFASNKNYNNTYANANTFDEQNEERSNFESKIANKKTRLNTKKQNKSLIYEIRQAPLPELAEAENIKPKVENTWAVGVNGTPLLSYRHVGSSNAETSYSTVNNSGLQQNYKNEKPLVSYSAGVNVNYAVSNRWNIQSGLYYSETGQVVEDINLTQSPWSIYSANADENYQVNTSNGNIVVNEPSQSLLASDNRGIIDYQTPSIEENGSEIKIENDANSTTEFVQKFEYYELPLIISYKVIDKKLNVNLSGGLSANFLTSNKTFIKNGSERSEIDAETEGVKNTTYSSIFAIGFEYPLATKLALSVNPTFRYSLNPINSNIKTHPYSFGFYTGFKYSF